MTCLARWLVSVLISLIGWMAVATVVVMVSLACSGQAKAGVPDRAQQYQRELTRVVQREWGLSGPVALHAAQIHQESTWRARVDSPVGAQGIAQFMPATAEWISEIYPDLGAATPYSPAWAFAAMARYNRHIYLRINPIASATMDECERLAMMLSGYNGGPGWVSRDRRLARAAGADPDRWWNHVEQFSDRAQWAFDENRHYPRRIIYELEPLYLRAGWRGRSACQ